MSALGQKSMYLKMISGTMEHSQTGIYKGGAGFRHPGTYPKNPVVFWGVHPSKKTHPKKNPHFYFNLILVYTL